MSVMNYKEYMDNLTAIFDAYGELIYLCNNFDTSRINDLFINIIQNYDYYANKIDIIHINEEEQEELLNTIIQTKEYIEMLEFVENNFFKIIKNCDLFKKKINSFKDKYIGIDKEILDDDEKLIDENLKSQLNTYYFNLKDLCRELNNITKTTKTTKTSNVTFNILPITTTNTIITMGLYIPFKMMIKSLQVIDSCEDDISAKDTKAIKIKFNSILTKLIKKFNEDIQDNKINIQEIITKIKEYIPAEHQGKEEEEEEEEEEKEEEEKEVEEVEEDDEEEEEAEKKKDKKKGNYEDEDDDEDEDDEDDEYDEDKKKDKKNDKKKDKKKDDERVFNFEFTGNSCYVHTALQLIIDNEDLCTKITTYMNNNEYDAQEDMRRPAKKPLHLLSNIIKFYNENKTEIGGKKIESYKKISEPLRDYLYTTDSVAFPKESEGEPLEVFNEIINILKELKVPKYDTYVFKLKNKVNINNNSGWKNDDIRDKLLENQTVSPTLQLTFKNVPDDNTTEITLSDLINLNIGNRLPGALALPRMVGYNSEDPQYVQGNTVREVKDYNDTDRLESFFISPMCKDLVIYIERRQSAEEGKISKKDVLLSKIITLKTLINEDDEKHVDVNYKLKGFAYYNGGHYVYYKLLSNDKWVKLNDTVPLNGELIDESNLPTDGGTMYYYKKMDDNTPVTIVPPIVLQKQPQISLLSWNLHYSIFKRKDNDSAYENNESNYEERRDTICSLLKTGNYDIICLQETKDIKELHEKYKVINNVESFNLASIFYKIERFDEISTEYHYHKKIDGQEDSDLIFSDNNKKDITKDDIHWRPIIKTILQDNTTEEQFMIINIWGIHINYENQRQQIIDYLKNITKDLNIRIIICGDMNEFSTIKNLELNSNAFDTFKVMNVTHTCCFDEKEILEKEKIKDKFEDGFNDISFTMMLDNNPDTTNPPLVTIGDKNTYSDHLSVNYKFTLKSPGVKAAPGAPGSQGKAAPAKPGAQGKPVPVKPAKPAPVPAKPVKPVKKFVKNYTFEKQADINNGNKGFTHIYEDKTIKYNEQNKKVTVKLMASLNAGHDNLRIGGGTINGHFNKIIREAITDTSVKKTYTEKYLQDISVQMHISCYMNYYQIEGYKKVPNVNDDESNIEIQRILDLVNTQAKNKSEEKLYPFDQLQQLFPNSIIEKMFLYIPPIVNRIESSLQFKPSNLIPGDIFIDILKYPAKGNNANRAMIYCVGPHKNPSGTKNIEPKLFLDAIKKIGKNIVNAIKLYNNDNVADKIDYVRICLISGQQYKPDNVTTLQIAKALMEGITEINEINKDSETIYNFAYVHEQKSNDGSFKMAFDELNNGN
jgi:endonuclease/exonuclease/phosphatase family metal-dependent hydrolase